MSRGLKFGVALMVVHLMVVALTAAHLGPRAPSWARWFFDEYGGLTGANTQYGFFAPNVGTQYSAHFDGRYPNGKFFTDALEPDGSGEVEIRMSNVVALFGSAQGKEGLKRSLTASWAGKVLGRHPGTNELLVRIQSYDLPSMNAYRSGTRPRWQEIYRARFYEQEPGEKSR